MVARGMLLAFGIGLLGLMACQTCLAGEVLPERMGMNYSVSAGVVIPVGNLGVDAAPTVSFDWYGPAGEPFSINGCVGLSGEWVEVKRRNGECVQLAPVFLNYRQYWRWGCYNWFFVTLGAGTIIASQPITEMELTSWFNFGWTGGIGINFSDNWYGQARFIGGEDPSQDGWVTVSIGYRW